MATFTTNYNLKKPDSTDFYNIEDSNSNFDIIDEQLKAAYDAIKDNEGSFKNMGINGVNIDDVFDYSYVVGITDDSYGTRPEQSWIIVMNFSATNFIVQIAMRTQNGGTANDNKMWMRNKYSSSTWSGWSVIFSAGNPPTAAQVGAAAESTHKLKTYTDVTQLGLTAANATVDGILQAMQDGSQAIIPLSSSYSTSEFPTQYGVLTVQRSNNSRGYAMVIEKSASPNIWYKGFNQTSWGNWFTLYTSIKKPSASDVGAAPTSHATSATTYGIGTSSNYGHVKLSDSTSSTSAASSGIAASPKAVKAAYDLANTASKKVYVQSSQPSSAADNTIWVW